MHGRLAEARPWLPQEALTDGALSRLLGAAVSSWSSKWVARSRVALASELALAASAGEGRWLVLEDVVALEVKDEARLALAALMLDAPRPVAPLTPADRSLLVAVADVAIDDLCASLATACGRSSGAQWQPATRLPPRLAHDALAVPVCAAEGTQLFRLLLDLELATALRKARIAARAGERTVRPLAEGIARAHVPVAARLGTCALTVAEFSGLAAGDVLVLDGDPAGPFGFAVAAGPRAGTCTIEQQGDAYGLKILQPVETIPCK